MRAASAAERVSDKNAVYSEKALLGSALAPSTALKRAGGKSEAPAMILSTLDQS